MASVPPSLDRRRALSLWISASRASRINWLRSLSPLDTEAVLASVRKTGKALIVYEDNKFVGYGAELAALISEEAFQSLDAPIVRVAGPDAPAAPYSHPLQDYFMVNTKTILAGIRKLAAY